LPPRKEAHVAAPATVVNLMDALRRSVEKERPATVKKARAGERRDEAVNVARRSGKGSRKAG